MTAEEKLKDELPAIREAKEQVVRDFPDDPDGLTQINFFRGGEPVCTMLCMPNRDLMLTMLKFGIIGMEADLVSYNTEVVTTKHAINPGTGKPWGPEEKQEVLRNHPDYWFDGLVEEGIIATVWTRGGDMATCLLPFAIQGTEVTWREPVFNDSKMLPGYIGEEISMFWHEEKMSEAAAALINGQAGERPDLPEMSEALKAEYVAMSDDERMARQDLTVLSILKLKLSMMGESAAIALHARQDTERSRIIRERAPGLGLGVADIPS